MPELLLSRITLLVPAIDIPFLDYEDEMSKENYLEFYAQLLTS